MNNIHIKEKPSPDRATFQTTLITAKENKPSDNDNPILTSAFCYIKVGLKVLPCKDKEPISKIKSVNQIRSKPIHEINCNFFFSEAPQIAILTGADIEVIDIDSKYDLTGKIQPQLLAAIKYTLPSVYEKLVIESTVNGGLHLVYKCSQIGGNQVFAQRYATTAEKEKGERIKTLIETRGEGGYIVCFPSPGYQLIQGEISDIEYISIEERQHLIAICKSFNLINEVELQELTKRQKKLPEAPWNVFNKEHDYKWISETLQQKGFEIVKEDDDRVYILRPASNAKTSGSIWKQTNILYLFSTSTEFEAGKPLSAFSVYCTYNFDGNVKEAAKNLAEKGIGIWNSDESEFYAITEKNKVEIKYSAIVEWLNDLGIKKYWYCDKDFEIVQVLDNIVQVISLDRIKKIFGSYIKESVPERVYNVFLSNIRTLFTKEGLITQIEDLESERFIKSDPKTGWVFFKNGALKVTNFNNELLSFASLDRYLWKRNIIQREFTLGKAEGDIKRFVSLISGGRDHIEAMFISAFGYLLHNYKDPVTPKVIILNDEFYDENATDPQGGSGKGLCIQLFQHFRNVYSVDGKSFRLDKSFPFQGVSLDTELFAVEDVAKGFDFERMFSIVTDGMTIEKKGKDEFKIPYEMSPKILVTSNYAIKGSGSSHNRRRYELEIASYFSDKYTPIDHFGHRFFVDWNAEEWNAFDNYMISCLQTYLNKGLATEVNINLKKKRLIQETNKDFINWIDRLHKEGAGLPELPIYKEDFKAKFTNLFKDYENKLTTSKFTQWLMRWAKDNNVVVDASNKHNGLMVYRFSGDLKAPKSYELLENSKFVNEGNKYVNHTISSSSYNHSEEEPDFF